jgi:large subunit ribosomal protein L29
MKMEEIKKMKKDDLVKKLAELRDQLRGLRFSAVAGQLKQTHVVKQIKKDIARILTVLNNQ